MGFDDEAVGQLIRKYDANQQALGRLQRSYDGCIEQIDQLRSMIKSQGISLDVTNTDFMAGFGQGQIPRNILEMFANCLLELRSATDEKRRLEDCLTRANLGRFVQPAPEPGGEV